MFPEEKLANRISKKYSAKPPVDVVKILQEYAHVVYAFIPIEDIDGVSLNIKVPGKTPKVIVNSIIPSNRQRFTLAHELGHIIIPWHLGSIITDRIVDFSQSYEDLNEHEEMEREANRFAAELLIPLDWIKKQYLLTTKLSEFHENITNQAKVSPIASAIRLIQILEGQIAFAEVDEDNVLKNFGKSVTTNIVQIKIGRKIDKDPFKRYSQYSTWKVGASRYHWWKFDSRRELYDDVSDDRSWREILNKMVNDLSIENPQKYKARLNAVIGAANGKFKRNSSLKSIEDFYSLCIQRIDRDDISIIFDHKDFEIFLKKKVIELYNR